jgi:hypothetical protein
VPGLTAIDDAGVPALTTSVTVALCGMLEAPLDVIVTVPLYVPGARPVGFTETLTVPGVVGPDAEVDNQVPPELVALAAVKFNCVPLLLTEML